MKRVLEIKKGGYTFQVDVSAVAHNRADYYGKKDPEPDYDTTYKSEYEHTMTDGYDAIDWFENNMNWEDVPEENRRISDSPKPPESPEDIEYDDGVEIELADVA